MSHVVKPWASTGDKLGYILHIALQGLDQILFTIKWEVHHAGSKWSLISPPLLNVQWNISELRELKNKNKVVPGNNIITGGL